MNLFRLLAFAAVAALLSNPALAQTAKPYEPQVGQQGKDVIWVPTPDEIVERMLRMAQTTPNDYVVDLGAGDGKIAIMAASKFGAKSLGIEYNPEFARFAQSNVEKAGVADTARGQQGDNAVPHAVVVGVAVHADHRRGVRVTCLVHGEGDTVGCADASGRRGHGNP